jgi:hypothetical protein
MEGEAGERGKMVGRVVVLFVVRECADGDVTESASRICSASINSPFQLSYG